MDARGKPLQQAVHWADQDVFSTKAHFYYDSHPPSLRIKTVKREDGGLYRCRVDFQKSPTRNWRINLTVLGKGFYYLLQIVDKRYCTYYSFFFFFQFTVPPTQLIILDSEGATMVDNTIGPYREGVNINITCMSSGGIPPPRVSWWKEHALLDDSFQILPDGTSKNILHLSRLHRKDLLTVRMNPIYILHY